jgi:hypothetical protein
MKSIYETRLLNARLLVQHVGTMTAFAEQIERTPTQVSRFLGSNPSRNIGEKMARHIEHSFCLPDYWLDTDHQNNPGAIHSHLNALSNEKYAELTKLLVDIQFAIDSKAIDEVTYCQLLQIAAKTRR